MRRQLSCFALLFACTEALCQAQRPEFGHEIASRHLNEDRLITVSVPENYGNADDTYPVLYVLDGEWIFDFATGAVSFLSNDSIGHIPNMLVVGIPNTDRHRDLSVTLEPKDGYEDFLKFLELEVIPFVDQEYRTSGFNLIYGWSSGSGICNQLLVRKPMLFDAYIQSGAGVGPGTLGFLSARLGKNSYKNKFLYVNAEGGGARADGVRRYSELVESLRPAGLSWKFEVLEKSTHVEVLPEGLQAGLSFVFSGFRVPDSIWKSGSKAVVSFLDEARSHYNFDVPIPQGAFVETASAMLQNARSEEAIALLRHALALYPDSAVIFGALGEAYGHEKQYHKAAQAYEMAMQKAGANRLLYLQNQSMCKKMTTLGQPDARRCSAAVDELSSGP